MSDCRRRRPVRRLLGARLRDHGGTGEMGKLRTSGVCHFHFQPLNETSSASNVIVECWLQQASELIVILGAPRSNEEHISGS